MKRKRQREGEVETLESRDRWGGGGIAANSFKLNAVTGMEWCCYEGGRGEGMAWRGKVFSRRLITSYY